MKTKVKKLSRQYFALVLALFMVISTLGFGSLITVYAYDTVQIHTNATISGSWASTNLSTSDGNYYTGTIYFKGKTSGNYESGIKINNAWKVFGGYWLEDNIWYNADWASGANDQIPPISTSTSTYIKGSVEFYKEYSGKPRLKIDQQALSALSTTVTVGSTTLTSGSTTTIGKTNSGGSGSYSNTYSVKQGSASGTDVTSSVLSGTTFTAPEVSTATTYYITTTVTDSNTSATKTSTAKTITVNPQQYNITFSQPSNGSIKVNNSISSPVSIIKGNDATVVVTPSSGYRIKSFTVDGTAVSAAVGLTSAYTYTISNITSTHTVAATMEVAPTKLAAPSIKLNNSTSDQTVDAARTQKIELSWGAVTNAASYKIYKDGSLVTTVTTTSYGIERGYSYSGVYTVVAVPQNTTNYSESNASNQIRLTVNKVKLANPSVSASATEVAKGSTVTFTFTNTNTSYSGGTDYNYQHSGESNTTYYNVSNLSWTTSALNTTGDRIFRFKTTSLQTDYYTDSDVVSITINVSAPAAYYLTGDLVFDTGNNSNNWQTNVNNYPINTFVSKNTYYRTVTISGGASSAKHYFRLTNLNNQYTVTSGQDTDMSTHDSLSNAVTASVTGTNGAMYVTGNGNFKIYVNQATSGQPKVWVVSNEWSLTATAYYKTFDLETDSYNSAVAGSTGGTVKIGSGTAGSTASAEIIKGNSTTLTAASANGYTFVGWYNNTDFADEHRESTNAAYGFTPDASGDYYALFKQNEPAHYNVTIPSQNNVSSITATYNGNSISMNSGTLSVPQGATVTVNITLSTGCQIGSTTPTGLTAGSSTFVMPGQSVSINANASKINYSLTAAVNPNYGTLKFYSNSGCTTQVTTRQYNQTFYAKYTPPSEYYALNNFSISGTGTTNTSTSNSIGTFKMGTANATITANVKAATPTFGTCPNMTVYANESFTYSGATLATLPNSTLTYKFNGGSYQSSSTFTAPATAGTYTLTIRASNKPTGISTAATATKTVNIIVRYRESTVTYYVDMHDNNMTNKTVSVAVVTDIAGTTVKNDSDNQPCSATLTRQQSSTVYAASINTPVTKSGQNNYSTLYFKITYGSTSFVKQLSSNQISTYIVDQASPEIWLEAVNEASQPLKLTYATRSTAVPASGYRRIYLAKPYSWQSTETSWENIGIYYWGDNPTDIGWNNGIHMNYLGYSSTSSSGYHYYYADIPKTITQNNTRYTVKNLIFQGWGTNTSAGNYTKAQTGNIENISSSANYFVLSKSGNSYVGTKGTDAVIPNYTRYVSDAKMNVSETATVSIAPTYTGKKVTYASGNQSVATVSNSGVITPVASGTTTITVYIYGTIGEKIQYGMANEGDRISYSVSVTVKDPSKFNGFNIMAFRSKEYTVDIPKISNNIPGYFDISAVETEVTGLQGAESSSDSAIVTPDSTKTVTVNGAIRYTAFTVKYAYIDPVLDSIPDYLDIPITATVVTKSIKASGSARYGLDHWEIKDGSTVIGTPNYTRNKTVDNGEETVVTQNIAFTDLADTYEAIFAEYNYVDVTFVYDYYEYKPQVVDGKTNYQYEAEYAGDEDRSSSSFRLNNHYHKTHTESGFEIRGYTAANITPSILDDYATQAIGVVPTNNYYSYTIDETTIPSSEISRNTTTYSATVYVHLKHSVKHYTVKVNSTTDSHSYVYQEYAEPSVGTMSKWYANSTAGPLLATGTSYKFRVKGNTHLVTQEGTVSTGDFNRSEVAFSHYEVTHMDNSNSQNVEYLLQNFYIADFFDKNKVLDPDNDNLPYDDAEFVGGGVVYYSMKNNSPNSNTVDAGYVNNSGEACEEEIKYMLKSKIEENYDSDLADEIGEEDAMKIAYGQEIGVTKNVENGINTGLIYRYLPLKTYTLENGSPVLDSDSNYVYTLNDNTFRYSNALQSYQYIYASGNENKVTNNGRNMRLYSYYIYSYLTYNSETNVPETKYEIILSDQYADASTYWDGN